MSTQPWQRPPCPPKTATWDGVEDGRTDGETTEDTFTHRSKLMVDPHCCSYLKTSSRLIGWNSVTVFFLHTFIPLTLAFISRPSVPRSLGNSQVSFCQLLLKVLVSLWEQRRILERVFSSFFFLMSNILCHQRWTFYVQRLPRLRWRGAAESDSG